MILSRLVNPLIRPCALLLNNNVGKLTPTHACKRWMAGGHKMNVMPSKLEWTIFKDEMLLYVLVGLNCRNSYQQMHFFVMLGLIPVGLIIAYTNVFIGQAELSEIPEGYHPKPYEYHKHPISRFIQRYIVSSYEQEYEKHLHCLAEEMKRMRVRRLEARVKEVMSLRLDYKGWYYEPVNEYTVTMEKERVEADTRIGKDLRK